jgi:hypothetical protein
MTDYTSTFITIIGSATTMDYLESESFSFQSIRPEPSVEDIDDVYSLPLNFHIVSADELKMFAELFRNELVKNRDSEDSIEEMRMDKSFGWRNAYWGPKWELVDNTLSRVDENTISIEALSATQPPLELLRFATERFPDLDIKIAYLGFDHDFVGVAYFRNGIISGKEIVNYEDLDSTLRENSARQDNRLLETLDEFGLRESIADYLDSLWDEEEVA